MNFATYQFVEFLVVVYLAFLAMPARFRWMLLLAASYIFYAAWSVPFIGAILLTTSIDYFASHKISESQSALKRKCFLWLAILLNLSVLAIFKYFNFFLSVQRSFAESIGYASPLPSHVDILLPLGISYYSFEAISYVVDVYRGMQPAPSWWSYNFYIMYFPHLLSGPIVRFKELWGQYKQPIHLPDSQRLTKALELIVLGYFFKLALADSCATVADPVFASPAAASSLTTWTAALAFATQIYMDFLGYTHIARGVSLLFNIELPINFDHPLHSTNMANFWQRWQISLSRWLHDYLFQPLGGSRKFLPMTMRNVFLTLLIAGIWHGAGWTYVVLGCYFGGTASGYHAYRRLRKKLLREKDRRLINNPVYKRLAHATTFICIVVSAVLFRSQTVQIDGIMLASMGRIDLLLRDLSECIASCDFNQIGLCCLFVFIMLIGPAAVRLYQKVIVPAPYWVKVQTATAMAVVSWIASSSQAPPFIYFQF